MKILPRKKTVRRRLEEALKKPLIPFQTEGVIKIERCGGRALLLDDMGLGKTVQAIAWAAINPQARPIVVVCPASVKWNWQREWRRFAGLRSYVCEGMKPKLHWRAARRAEILIINYDILTAWLPLLLRVKPKLLILDECHYLQNRSAKRTKSATALSRKVPYILPLSGTPIDGRPMQFFPVLNMVRPKEFSSMWKFGFEYCAPTRNKWGGGWDFNGASNLDALHAKLQGFMIRRMKSEVWKQMPKRVRSVIPIDLSNRRDYDKAEENFLSWLKKNKGKEAFKRARRAEAVVKMGALKQLAAEGKLKFVIQWIKDWLESTDEKLIVFAIHKKILRALKKAFPGSLLVDGSVSNNRRKGENVSPRQKMIDLFQRKKKYRLLFGQLHAIGQGVTLTAAANVVKLELGWTPSKHEQAEDRVLRIGQKKKRCHFYYLVGRDTIEEKILSVLQSKHKVTGKILDGKKAATMKLLDMLMKEAA